MQKLDFKQKLMMIFFLSLPFVDLATSLSTRFFDFPITIGIVVKGLSLALSIIYVFGYSKCKYRKHTIIYILCLCGFAGLYFLTKPDIWNIENLFTEITFAFKFFYFPVMTVCLYNVFQDFDMKTGLIKRIILINSLVYSVLILIPHFTGTGFLTYGKLNSGEYGWFYASNEVSAILVILAVSILDLMDDKKKKKLLLAIPIIYAASLVGTKVSFIGLIVSVLVAVVVFIFKNKTKRFSVVATVLVILVICCIISPAVNNISRLTNNITTPPPATRSSIEIDIVVTTTLSPAEEMINNDPFLKIVDQITSGRLYLLIENGTPYVNGNLITKLFGLGMVSRPAINYTFYRRLVEIDVLDIFIHYGIIGFCTYFAPFIYLAHKFIRNRKSVLIESYAYLLVALLGIGISFIAGHVLSSPAVSIYIVLLILLVMRQTEENYN